MTLTLDLRLDRPVTSDAPLLATIDLPHQAPSVSDARVWLRTTLAGWGVVGVVADDAVLLLSEITTNAVLYSGGTDPITVTAAWWAAHLRITVSDPDRLAPGLDRDADEHGRGLLIVEKLAARWGTAKTSNGKVTFFELAVEGPR